MFNRPWLTTLVITTTVLLIPTVSGAATAEVNGFNFLRNELSHQSGGIYSNLDEDAAASEQYGVNHQMLAESTGLAMEYAVLANRPRFFSKQAAFAHNVLRVKKYSTYRWRVGKRLGYISAANATIDDLRIIHGYLLAYDQWGNTQYLRRARSNATGLKRYAFRNDVLSNAVWWQDGDIGTDDTAWISYFDFPTWQLLAEFDPFWSTVIASHYTLTEAAALGNGLYRERYTIDTQSFEEQAKVDTIHQLFIANHLAAAGYTTLAQQTLDFFKTEYTNTGEVRGRYTTAGVAASPYQDISIYAQLADLASFLNDDAFAQTMKQKVRSLQQTNGAFTWSKNDTIYSFVQLTSLRALARWSITRGYDQSKSSPQSGRQSSRIWSTHS